MKNSTVSLSFLSLMAGVVALVFAVATAPVSPLSSLVIAGVLAVILLPRLAPIRTETLYALGIVWGLSLVPAFGASTTWKLALFLGAQALLFAQIALEEGVGIPILRFFRSPRVQGWAALTLGPPVVAFGIGAVDRGIRASGLAPEWRWSVVALIALVLAPSKWVGGSMRLGWGLPAYVAAALASFGSGQWTGTDLLTEAAMNAVLTLAVAGFVHDAFGRLRRTIWSNASRSDLPLRPKASPTTGDAGP